MKRRPFAARQSERRAEAAAYAAHYAIPEAICALCGKGCDSADFCFGCDSYVCAGCDNPSADQRPQAEWHTAEAHRVRPKVIQ